VNEGLRSHYGYRLASGFATLDTGDLDDWERGGATIRNRRGVKHPPTRREYNLSDEFILVHVLKSPWLKPEGEKG
jgi:hypothetical protein